MTVTTSAPTEASVRADFTVVVPTRNESGNITALVARLESVLAGMPAEILFVDDSDDDTPDRVLEVARHTTHRVRLLHRPPGERAGGLGTAVLAGFGAADTTWALVMDADLQHPPELVPELVRAGCDDESDLVVASRYRGAGDSAGLGGVVRHAVSRSSTLLTKT
jgi:glycosyltransferase involved in cell wall biosynthesis